MFDVPSLLSTNFCTKEEKHAIARALDDADFRSPYGRELSKILRHGVGIHHAGLLPKYRLLVEKLTARGLLKVVFEFLFGERPNIAIGHKFNS